MDGVLVGDRSIGSRKRQKVAITKRKIEKSNRYRDKDPLLAEFRPPCSHCSGRFKCGSLKKSSLIELKKKVFEIPDKTEQDRRLTLLMNCGTVQRERPRQQRKRQVKKFSVKYFMKENGKQVPVCSNFFRKVFGVGQCRLNRIANFMSKCESVCEKRGGNRKEKMYCEKRQSVIDFISSLRAVESHYSRNKSRRLYLPSHLSIAKLWRIYNKDKPENLKVKKWFFWNIFVNKFNLGFGTPATDTCSYCARLRYKIKSTVEPSQKNLAMTELTVHKARAKAFFKLMKESYDNAETFCFDLQQVQNLPKLSIGEAYYSRQMGFYVSCITDVACEDPHFYVWTDGQAGRGSVEIASALCHFLTQHKFKDETTMLRLFSDGCGGQNKNMHLVHALALWLLRKAPQSLKDILLVFPVRGHSFLPCDRVFGVIEKQLRRVEEILNPEEYKIYYKDVGKVLELGGDWELQNFKELSEYFKPMDGIRDMKRIFLKRKQETVSVKMESTFRYSDPTIKYGPILKRGRRMNSVPNPSPVPLTSHISAAKKKDVINLLTAGFGEQWCENPSLSFYSNILELDNIDGEEPGCDNEGCDCLEDDVGIRI